MKAAIVRTFDRPPIYGDFSEPTPQPGETPISVTAAALSHLTWDRASGSHYSADSQLPIIPGIDGVGRTPDGRRVYFAATRPPYGAMAERTVTRGSVPVPEGVEDTVAAAAANPGMSCWIPLTRLAPVQPGESVLVNGATGSAGRMAVQVAKYLGASRVIATGRDEAKLRELTELGADQGISLRQPAEALRTAVRTAARDANVSVVLDYLWGPSAETILSALAGPGAPRGAARIRYVEVGSAAGPTITLDGAVLRSAGIEILGTGLGSVSNSALIEGIGHFLEALATARFHISVEVRPLAEVESAWARPASDARLVFSNP